MTKRPDYWETETFPLVENRHEVGKFTMYPIRVIPTVSPVEALRLRKLARDEAPPRHCLCCGKVLVKQARINKVIRPGDVLFLSYVEYGYRGKGYWDTLKCMRVSAPKLAAALIRIRNTPFAGKAFSRETHGIFHGIRQVALQALNHFQHSFN